MTPTRYQRSVPAPWGSFANLRNELDQLFNQSLLGADWPGESSRLLTGWAPPVDLHEDKDNLVLKVELPGMKKEEIDISLHEGVLTVSGERKAENCTEDAETHRVERFYGKFGRSVALPVPVNSEAVKAAYADGVLTVTLPKADHAKPRQININA